MTKLTKYRLIWERHDENGRDVFQTIAYSEEEIERHKEFHEYNNYKLIHKEEI